MDIATMPKISLISLPPEVLSNIFIKLEKRELRNVMLTCKFLRAIIKNDNSIWRSRAQGSLIINNNLLENSKPNSLPWYDRCRISHNWCNGIYKSKVLIHHYDNYMPWIKFHNSEVLLVSFGSEIHAYKTDKKGIPNCRDAVWRFEVPTVVRHDVRTNDVSRFVFNGQMLVCGNRDGCFALYETNDITEKPSLLCHILDCHDSGRLEVTAVELINTAGTRPVVVTGSNYSSLLKLFTIRSGTQSYRSSNDKETYVDTKDVSIKDGRGVCCMAYNSSNNRLAIGLYENSKPILLDVNTNQIIMTDHGSRNVVRDVQWHNKNVIVYVTHAGKLQFIDTRNQEVVFDQMDPFQSTLYCVKSDGDQSVVVGSSEYSRCVLFDVRNTKHHQQIYFTQRKVSPIYSLDFDATKLIAAADRSVAILNFDDTARANKKDYSHIFELVQS